MLTLLRLPKSYDHDSEAFRELIMGNNVTHSQNEVLHGNLNLDPFVVRQCWPHEMWFRDRGLVGMKDDLRLFIVDMQST